MVCLGDRDKLSAKSSMAVAPEQTVTAAVAPSPPKPLHNFDLPWLRWGSQRHLRCMNVNDSGAGASRRRSEGFRFEAAPIAARREPPRRRHQIHGGEGGEEEEQEGIAAVSRKLIGDLKTAAAEMHGEIIRDDAAAGAEKEDEKYEVAVGGGGEGDVAAGVSAAAEEVEVRPWNLRTRRAACKAPAEDKVISSSSSPEKAKTAKREKFSVALSKKEIEADFMVFLGHKPPRRPKKRPRNVQKQLDYVFPGLLLGEITADRYKVAEES